MAKKKWIPKDLKKGALHKQLGIAADKTIPLGTLKAAAEEGGTKGKRARLALVLRRFHKKGGKGKG